MPRISFLRLLLRWPAAASVSVQEPLTLAGAVQRAATVGPADPSRLQ